MKRLSSSANFNARRLISIGFGDAPQLRWITVVAKKKIIGHRLGAFAGSGQFPEAAGHRFVEAYWPNHIGFGHGLIQTLRCGWVAGRRQRPANDGMKLYVWNAGPVAVGNQIIMDDFQDIGVTALLNHQKIHFSIAELP